jgi:hypothetical protein
VLEGIEKWSFPNRDRTGQMWVFDHDIDIRASVKRELCCSDSCILGGPEESRALVVFCISLVEERVQDGM